MVKAVEVRVLSRAPGKTLVFLGRVKGILCIATICSAVAAPRRGFEIGNDILISDVEKKAIMLSNRQAAMRVFRFYSMILLAAGGALIAPIADVAAQQRMSATYQDWILQCVTVAKPTAHKFCDIAQLTQVKGKDIPFSRVAIDGPVKAHPTKLTIQLPVNVSLSNKVRIEFGKTHIALAAFFGRCLPAGCFADFVLDDDTLQKFRSAEGLGKIGFKDAGGHDLVIPLSFNGFRQAYDALSKQ